MNTQEQANFERIAKAIEYIQARFKAQPSLAEIAEHVELSPSHFQRLFTDWAGTSPKKFLQYISIEHAKKLLNNNRTSLLEASMKTGLSGSSRLHDLFVTIEGMTPGEYKNGGASLVINYSFTESLFGEILIASTSKGVCYLAFVMQTHAEAFVDLRFRFPQATLREQRDSLQESALTFFTQDWNKRTEIKLHLKGTAFQLKVWEALLKIPMGQLSTYGAIATNIQTPNACRAVGTAVGQNPVSFLIPCHRVIQSTGVLGNYHWGPTRKTVMIGWEAARTV